ncbi:MAG: hypothetical protein ACK6D3_16605 [Planctomycetaceae bacterium]
MTPPMNPSPDDLPADNLRGDATEEWQSAWYDRELANVESALVEGVAPSPSPGRLQDYQRLSQLLQSLPAESLPADFANRVIAQLPDSVGASRPPLQSSPERGFRRFAKPVWAGLAASLAGLAVLVGRWQPMTTSSPVASSRQLPAPAAPAAKIAPGVASFESAVRPSLASRLEEIPLEKLAIVRIRVPQRGAVSEAESAAMDLTEQAFGEHSITQVQEGSRSPEGAPAAPQVAAGAKVSSPGDPPDPMQLLVVGESEAIVQAIEQLLRNLEQTELEEEIRAVARTELDQLSSELSPSLGQYLDNLEQTWSPAVLAEQVLNRGVQPSRIGNPAEPRLPGESGERLKEGHSRSRGSMAWVSPESLTLHSPDGSPETAAASRPAARRTQSQVKDAEGASPAEEPAQPAMGGRARPPENARIRERSFSTADKAAGAPPASDSVEGRRPRRVLIQLICDPAG